MLWTLKRTEEFSFYRNDLSAIWGCRDWWPKFETGLNIIIELMIKKLHGLSPSGGLVSPSGGFASLFFDQVEYFASIKLCQALSRQGAIIKIPVVRCHYLLCSSAQWIQNAALLLWTSLCQFCVRFSFILERKKKRMSLIKDNLYRFGSCWNYMPWC